MKRVLMVLAIGIIFGVGSLPANATFMFFAQDLTGGGGNYVAIDEVLNDNASGVPGVLGLGFVILGPWSISGTGYSKPWLPSGNMDLNAAVTTNFGPGGSGWLYMALTDTDHALGSMPLFVSSYVGGSLAAGGFIEFDEQYDPKNAEFGGDIIHYLAFSNPGGSSVGFSGEETTLVENSPLFSLTEAFYIGHTATGAVITSFNAEKVTTPIPEPGTLILLGSGLIGLAGYGKYRFSRRKK